MRKNLHHKKYFILKAFIVYKTFVKAYKESYLYQDQLINHQEIHFTNEKNLEI